MEFFTNLGCLGLFLSAFLAATILPLSSEVVLIALLISGIPAINLIVIATVGNVLGSLINYALGYWASVVIIKKWLRLSEQDFTQAELRHKKYGKGALFFAWLPIIGDPLTVMAGVLRIHLLCFVVIVSAGKLLRYVVTSYFVLQVA